MNIPTLKRIRDELNCCKMFKPENDKNKRFKPILLELKISRGE